MSLTLAYLGDSVYVEVDAGMLKLTTNNGYDDDPRNTIFLEPEVYEALIRYVASQRVRATLDIDEHATTEGGDINT